MFEKKPIFKTGKRKKVSGLFIFNCWILGITKIEHFKLQFGYTPGINPNQIAQSFVLNWSAIASISGVVR